MTTLPDLLYVAYFAVAGPLIDYLVFWPAFLRRSKIDPARARTWLWALTIGSQWAGVALGAALWLSNDRSWRSFGFSMPEGWRLWVPVALGLLLVAYAVYAVAAVARDAEARESVRRQKSGKIPVVLPRTRAELSWWGGVSLTAGFCEEFLFRGYFIWALSPWLGWWGAAALSVALFAGWHAYQGWNGALRTGIVGAFFTLVVALSGSLWPAIVLHALVDLGAGIVAWLALREGQATGEVVEAGGGTQSRSAAGVESTPDRVEPGASPGRGTT